MCLRLMLCCAVILQIALISPLSEGLHNSACSTKLCLQEAAKVSLYLDADFSPCENPYQFFCNTFLKIAHGDEDLEALHQMKLQLRREIYEIYNEPIQSDDHRIVKLAKSIYQNCIKEYPDKLIQAIKKELSHIGGWPLLNSSHWNATQFKWLERTYTLRELGLNYKTFFDMQVITDPDDNSRYIFEILPLDDTGYEEKEDMLKVIEVLDVRDRYHAEKEVIKIYELIHDIRVVRKWGHCEKIKLKIKDIPSDEGNINWLEFIKNLSGSNVQVTQEEYVLFPVGCVKVLENLLSRTPKEVQANLLMWEAVKPLFQLIHIKHYYGSKVNIADACYIYSRDSFALNPIEIIYAKRYISDDKRTILEEMVSNIKQEFIDTVQRHQWIVKATKQKIINALTACKLVIGLNGNYSNNDLLDELDIDLAEVQHNDFLHTFMQANKNLQTYKYKKVNKSPADMLLEDRYVTVGSWVSTLTRDNILVIPTTIANSFYFNKDRPAYLNYGTLGTAIAKELSWFVLEYVNDEARKYIKCALQKGDVHTFTNEDIQQGIARMVAYRAYRKVAQTHGEELKLIGTQYTPNQLFWISSVYHSCNTSNPDGDYLGDMDLLRSEVLFNKDFHCSGELAAEVYENLQWCN